MEITEGFLENGQIRYTFRCSCLFYLILFFLIKKNVRMFRNSNIRECIYIGKKEQ